MLMKSEMFRKRTRSDGFPTVARYDGCGCSFSAKGAVSDAAWGALQSEGSLDCKRTGFARESRFQRWRFFGRCSPGASPQADSECRAVGAKGMTVGKPSFLELQFIQAGNIKLQIETFDSGKTTFDFAGKQLGIFGGEFFAG